MDPTPIDPNHPVFQEGIPASLLKSPPTIPQTAPSDEYPPGTPWWFVIADRRAHTLGNTLYLSAGSLLAIAPELYEMLPGFKADMPASLFHHLTAAIGALMLAGKAWSAVQSAKKMKEST